ncbi:MAG: VWA domain-containing protein [Motiliproteus sp.]|nr:VWA domain-containing protein [Motiliproteus sp.]MCW9053521.1 VWA domain-containing protein [Motiliproteus sp.]
MAKPIEIICIFDRSGSMQSIIDEAVAAFNQFVEQQKAEPGKARLTLVSFDNHYELIHQRMKLKDVPPLERTQVEPRGMTALFDAIGRTINSAKPDRKTICLIQTDGMENASEEYHGDQIKTLIAEKEAAGWEFVFIGAGIDAMAEGSRAGIAADKCYQVSKDSEGVVLAQSVLCEKTTRFRQLHDSV